MMLKVLDLINELVVKYNYRSLPKKASIKYRKFFIDTCPQLNHNMPIFDSDNNIIAFRFTRIVVGDYGAFIEFDEIDANHEIFQIPENQRFRLSSNFCGKYLWMTTGKTKIYKQLRTVSYADYLVGKYYISPFEVHQ
jgi:hypothetical protein